MIEPRYKFRMTECWINNPDGTKTPIPDILIPYDDDNPPAKEQP